MTLSTVRQVVRARKRGFTIIEITIVVAVIAILAALLAPVIIGVVERSRVATARGSLAELAHTIKRVRDDSGYWPYQDTVWSPAPGFPLPEIGPRAYNTNDTVMQNGGLPVIPGGGTMQWCSQVQPGFPCWNGPYMSQGSSMGSLVDPWGNQYMYSYIRPNDGWGGGIAQAPNGVVVVWSNGPDGIDQTGCTTGACGWNSINFAQGLPSLPTCDSGGTPGSCSDDIIQWVATSLY
jgi:prepilin-type N-terminal cleavage/methylation domain-containing protein